MIITLLLAAGSSRRFGSDKLLSRLGDGTPVVEATVRNLNTADCRILAVVRPGATEVGALLAKLPGVTATECPDADLGMGHSLAWGVAQSADASGWLVALADMPFVQPASFRSVVQRLDEGASIAAPGFGGKRGHPVGFSSRWRKELLQLAGDRGGASIIRRHPQFLVLIPCSDPGVLMDVDLPVDPTGDALVS